MERGYTLTKMEIKDMKENIKMAKGYFLCAYTKIRLLA